MTSKIKDSSPKAWDNTKAAATSKKEKPEDAWDNVKAKASKTQQAMKEKAEDTWGGAYQDKQKKATQKTKTDDAIKNS